MPSNVREADRAFIVKDVNRTMRSVMLTVQLVGQRRLQWKCWLAKQLIRAAAYTMGCGCTITMGVRKGNN
jgi:hypothetical protein